MTKLLKSEKGNITLTVIAIAMLLLIFTLPVIAIMQANSNQTRIQIGRVQYYYKLKAELTRLESTLGNDIEYLHNNTSGTMGILSYSITEEDYSNDIQYVYNENTGTNEGIIVANKYIYTCKIDNYTYKIQCRKDLITGQSSVVLVH